MNVLLSPPLDSKVISYERIAIEDFDFAPNSFDIVISSLTFHYLESFDTVCTEVYKSLTEEGVRHACFWGEDVTKYHKTFTTYVNGLIKAGFCITHLVEPQPDESMLDTVPGMRDELRRPMMLLIATRKN